MNAYPHGKGKIQRDSLVDLSNTNVSLSSLRTLGKDVYSIRLFNNQACEEKCIVKAFGCEIELSFGKYEVKTMLYKDGELKEQAFMF